MKTWHKIALFMLPVIAIVGIRIYFIHRERTAPVVVQPRYQERPLTADEMVQPRKLYIDDVKSAKDLDGKTVWVQSGYSLDYFPYTAHHVDFHKKVGVLPSVQALEIKDIVSEKAPANLASRIPLGNKQVFAVFTMPGSPQQYATAIGYLQGNDSKFYCDDIFYYDDPHQMYKHWPAAVWQAVDQHRPIPGMNELQVAMTLGVVQQSDSSDIGNRTVTYDTGGKKWSVTFQNDKAVNIQHG